MFQLTRKKRFAQFVQQEAQDFQPVFFQRHQQQPSQTGFAQTQDNSYQPSYAVYPASTQQLQPAPPVPYGYPQQPQQYRPQPQGYQPQPQPYASQQPQPYTSQQQPSAQFLQQVEQGFVPASFSSRPERLREAPAPGSHPDPDLSSDTRVNEVLSANARRGGLVRIDPDSELITTDEDGDVVPIVKDF